MIKQLARWLLLSELKQKQDEHNAHVRKQDDRIIKLTTLLDYMREAAPELSRVRAAIKIHQNEYVGQATRPLWEWAWEQAKPPEGSE
jgi:hypothetical protein